jgi:anti-sigma B factor antagonist
MQPPKLVPVQSEKPKDDPLAAGASAQRLREYPEPFFTTQRSTNGQVLIKVGGECDAATLDELNEALARALASEPHEIVIDLANTTFVDSLTLGAFTATAKQIRARGGSFRLVGVSATEVQRALEITGLRAHMQAQPNASAISTMIDRH